MIIKQKYLDSSEEFLLHFFNEPESKKEKEISRLLSNNPTWPILYHLSPQRRLILEWYDFKPNGRLLEIGAGCGALTKTFLDKCSFVTCIELEKIRADIIKKRYSDYTNYLIVSSDFAKYISSEKFDYISLIGVLEYAGKYYNNPDIKLYSYEPFLSMLKKTLTLLKTDGTLFLAIENKLGLKYLSGCPEDHYNISFESWEDYPDYNGIRTFSKRELKYLLNKVGFTKVKFLYPYPDYKLPSVIYSKKLLLNQSINLLSEFPTPNYSSPRNYFINETMTAKTLIDAKLLDQFSNSFLVIAKQ